MARVGSRTNFKNQGKPIGNSRIYKANNLSAIVQACIKTL